MEPVELMDLVQVYLKLGFLKVPPDLLVIKEHPHTTISHRVLTAVEMTPPRMERVLSFESSKVAISKGSNDLEISGKGWGELVQRGKGHKVLENALRAHWKNTKKGSGERPSDKILMQAYCAALEDACPFQPANLTTSEGIVRYTLDLVEFHEVYGLDNYFIKQIARMFLWWYIVAWVAANPESPVSALHGIFPDMKGNMQSFESGTFSSFEATYGFPFILCAIYLCLVGSITAAEVMSIPGLVSHLNTRSCVFFENFGYKPGIYVVNRWAWEWKFTYEARNRKASTSPLPVSLPPGAFDLTGEVDLFDVADILSDVNPTTGIQLMSNDKRGSYTMRLTSSTTGVVTVVYLTMRAWHELFVTSLPYWFLDSLWDAPGTYQLIPPGARKETEPELSGTDITFADVQSRARSEHSSSPCYKDCRMNEVKYQATFTLPVKYLSVA